MDETDATEREAETRKQRNARQAADDADFRWQMGTKRGRRVVWRSLERAGIYRTSFSTDPLVMAMQEGKKEEGRHLVATMQRLCPELFVEMMKENANG